jgi:Domain of unknown function (DUF5666)
MSRTFAALALVVGFAAAPARAHEEGGRAMGVVESITPERIVVQASDGHRVEFTVTRDTRFFQGEKPARLEDIRVGQRAVVQGKKAGERLEAVRVKLGAPAAGK